jgi:hypothetical protein
MTLFQYIDYWTSGKLLLASTAKSWLWLRWNQWPYFSVSRRSPPPLLKYWNLTVKVLVGFSNVLVQSSCWTVAAFSCYTQSVGLLGLGIRTSQGLYLHTGIHALSSIRTHDPNIPASEDSSYRRPRGHRDRTSVLIQKYQMKDVSAVFLSSK